jgi:proteic killer suppression protein
MNSITLSAPLLPTTASNIRNFLLPTIRVVLPIIWVIVNRVYHAILAHVAQHATFDYYGPVIKSFKHKGLRKFFQTGSTAGIQPKHKVKLADQLDWLDSAVTVQDMDVPGWQLHELKGRWSVSVNGNWRMTFEFENADAFVVDYEDYH